MSDDADDEQEMLKTVLGELLNLAAQVAELQTTDEAAEDIYAMCDFVADYYQIERARAITTENDDGSITTRFETIVGAEPQEDDLDDAHTSHRRSGNIRTKNLPKLRLIDADTPINIRKRTSDSDPEAQ